MSQIVTELKIDADGAQRGADQYVASMDKCSQAMQRSLGAMGDSVQKAQQSFGGLGALAIGLGGTIGSLALFVDAVVKANGALAQMNETARLVQLTTDQFQRVSFAFKVGGASDQDINSSLTKMTELLNDAQRNENSLSKLLDANNVKYKERNGALIDTNKLLDIAADLVKRAASPQDEAAIARMLGLSQSMVPTLREWGSEAQRAGDIISKDVIDRASQFDKEWRKASVEWETYIKAALSGALPVIDDLINRASTFASTVSDAVRDAAKGVTSDSLNRAGFNTEDQAREAGEALRKALGDTANARNWDELVSAWREFFFITERTIAPIERIDSAFSSIAQNAGKLNALYDQPPMPAYLSPNYYGPPGSAKALGPFTNIPGKDTDVTGEFDRASKALERMTAAREADIQTVGKSVGAQEYLRQAYRLNEAALQQDGEVTDETRKKIEALAQRAGEAAQKLAEAQFKSNVDFQRDTVFLSPTDQGIAAQLHRLKGDDWPAYMHSSEANTLRWVAAMKDLQSVTSDFASGFAQDMMRGTRAIDALHNAVQRLATTLVDMAIKRLVADALGSLLGGPTGGGGALSALFKSQYGNVFDHGNAIQFADGGVVSQPAVFQMSNGGLASIAEREPEAIMPLKRGADGRLGVAASGGGGSLTIAPVVNVSMPAGAKPSDGQQFGAEISRAIIATVQAEMVKQKRSGGLLN